MLHLPFIELPPRVDYPDYYTVIKTPISLQDIERKLSKAASYSLDEFSSDIDLLFGNARKYNAPKSQIYKDATTLRTLAKSTIADLLDIDAAPKRPRTESAKGSHAAIVFISSALIKLNFARRFFRTGK